MLFPNYKILIFLKLISVIFQRNKITNTKCKFTIFIIHLITHRGQLSCLRLILKILRVSLQKLANFQVKLRKGKGYLREKNIFFCCRQNMVWSFNVRDQFVLSYHYTLCVISVCRISRQ